MANLLFTARGAPSDSDSVIGVNGTVAGSESRWTFGTLRTWLLTFLAPTDSPTFTGDASFEDVTADTLNLSAIQISGHATTLRTTAATDVTFPTSGTLSTDAGVAAAIATAVAAIPTATPNTINTQLASYTLALTDATKTVLMNVAGANNLTVPLNSAVAFPIGTIIPLGQIGAGLTTIVATGGVTITPPPNGTLISTGQGANMALVKTGTDAWSLGGDLRQYSVTRVNTQTASYTLALTDALEGAMLEMNVAGANNLTIPTNAAVPIPIGSVVQCMQRGAGLTSFVTTGLTFNARGAATKSAGQIAYFGFRKVGTDTWDAFGDISA